MAMFSDDSDIPMLDVGDFEVLDECEGEEDEDENHHGYGSHGESDFHDSEDYELRDSETQSKNDTDRRNILTVSIDVEEHEFLENVATDLSNNFEDEAQATSKSSAQECMDSDDIEVLEIVKKNSQIALSAKESLNRPSLKGSKLSANHHDFGNNNVPIDKTLPSTKPSQSNISSQMADEMPANSVLQIRPSFLKSDFTDEEIMLHFDEIENTVLNSECFVIQNDVEQAEEEANSEEIKNTFSETEKDKEVIPVEDWDTECDKIKRKQKIQFESLKLKETEMWYKVKVMFILIFHQYQLMEAK